MVLLGYVGGMTQTYAGRAPLDLGVASAALAVSGVALLATAAVLAILGLVRRSDTPVAGSSTAPIGTA